MVTGGLVAGLAGFVLPLALLAGLGALAAEALGAVALVGRARLEPLPLEALAASSSTACSSVMVSAVVPSGREAFTLPCFT